MGASEGLSLAREGTAEMKVQAGSEGLLKLPDGCWPVALEGSCPLAEGSAEGSWGVLGLPGDTEGPGCWAGLGSASGLCSSCSS